MQTPALQPLCTIAGHGLNTVAGYVVRKTYFDGTPHEDMASFPSAFAYAEAADAARPLRLRYDGHAVIDPVYACGCRGRG